MDRLGIAYEAVAPGVDEEPYKQRGLTPVAMVTALARAKAHAVADQYEDAVIIGSDQCAEIDGHILDKPQTEARAVAQLEMLAGRTHRLLTGVCVLDTKTSQVDLRVDEHHLAMRALTTEQLRAYVAYDRPLECAGSYKIESLGVALFESVKGEDGSAIVGLPMMYIARTLAALGVDVFSPR